MSAEYRHSLTLICPEPIASDANHMAARDEETRELPTPPAGKLLAYLDIPITEALEHAGVTTTPPEDAEV